MSDSEKIVYLQPGQAYRLSPSESVTLRLDTGPVGDLDKKLDSLLEWRSACQDEMRATSPGIADPRYAEKVMADIRNEHKKQAVEAIKQAFKDAGWLRTVDVGLPAVTPYDAFMQSGEMNGSALDVKHGLMTGQEWYDRFEKELNRATQYPSFQLNMAKGAAKKAAGIE